MFWVIRIGSKSFASGIQLLKEALVSSKWREFYPDHPKERRRVRAQGSLGRELADALDAFGMEANKVIPSSKASVKKCRTANEFYRYQALRLRLLEPFITAYVRVKNATVNAESWLWKLWGPHGSGQVSAPVDTLYGDLCPSILYSGIEAPNDLEKSIAETHARLKAYAEEIHVPELKKLVDKVRSVAVVVRSAAKESKVHSIVPELPPNVGIGRDATQSTDMTKKRWKPPKGYVGSKTIMSDYKVPRSTLEGWRQRDEASGKLKKPIEKDPQANENYYPEKWFKGRFANYKPRRKM